MCVCSPWCEVAADRPIKHCALSAIFVFTRTPHACTKGRIAPFYFSFGKMKLTVVGLVLVFGLTCVQSSNFDVARKESELITISTPQSL